MTKITSAIKKDAANPQGTVQEVHPEEIARMIQHEFQMIYLEAYSWIRGLNQQQIQEVLIKGLAGNLKRASFNVDSVRFLGEETNREAGRIASYNAALQRAWQDYHEALLRGGKETESQQTHEFHAAVASWYQKGLGSSDSLLKLVEKGKSLLDRYQGNYWLEYMLGWLHFHLLRAPKDSQDYLTGAADKSIQEDNPLAELALRTLAQNYFVTGDQHSALVSMQGAISLDEQEHQQYRYELARYYAASGDIDDSRFVLKHLIKESSLFYVQAQSDPAFRGIEGVNSLLDRFHHASLEAIQEDVRTRWKQGPAYDQTFAGEYDPDEILEDVYAKHEPLLSHQSYALLSKKDKVSRKVLRTMTSSANARLTRISAGCDKELKRLNQRWKHLNKLGGALIYIAAILVLTAIFLFTGTEILGLRERMQMGDIPWRTLIPVMFASIFSLGVLGIGLVQYRSPRMKKLLEKKAQLLDLQVKLSQQH